MYVERRLRLHKVHLRTQYLPLSDRCMCWRHERRSRDRGQDNVFRSNSIH